MSSRVQLLELDVDCLAHIVSLVPTDDLLPVALTCKQLAAAHDHALAIDGCTFEWTTSATKTFSRMKWAVDVMHAAPSSTWYVSAVANGQLLILRWLQQRNIPTPRGFGYADTSGMSVMHRAAARGHTSIMQWLVASESRCSLHIRCNGNFAPMHYAAMNGHLATVRWLRERGAPAVPFCGGPILPISLAARGGYGDTVEYLRLAGAPAPVEIKHGDWADWVDAVHLAVGRNDLRRLVYLHDEVGVPLTMKRGAGEWPIHTAARFGHLESVKYLHEHGAALGVKDIHGTQPMHLAADGAHLEIIEYLHTHGAPIDSPDVWGRLPLHHVTKSVSGLSAVIYFVTRGVLATAKDNAGNQLLHGDCGVHVLQWLHEQGVSLTAENDMGERPMDTAARANAYEMIGWLWAHGVALT